MDLMAKTPIAICGVVSVLTLAVGTPTSRGDSPARPGEFAPTHETRRLSIGAEVAHGVAMPRQQVTMTAPIETVLMHVYVQEGEEVKPGHVLAVMDIRVAAATVDAARLRADNDETVRHAQLALEFAQLQFDRTTKARGANAATEVELDEARLQRDQAQAGYDAAIRAKAIAAATLEIELQQLEQHKIRAPFEGKVTRLFVQPGSTLTTSDPVLTLVSFAQLEAQVYLPADLYGKLDAGNTYHLLAQEPVNHWLRARLKMIDPLLDPASRTFRCVFSIDNPRQELPAGFPVQFPIDQLRDVRQSQVFPGPDGDRP